VGRGRGVEPHAPDFAGHYVRGTRLRPDFSAPWRKTLCAQT
jgi:hypothetical protein